MPRSSLLVVLLVLACGSDDHPAGLLAGPSTGVGGAGGTGGSGGSGATGGGGSGAGGGSEACIGQNALGALGKDHVVVGVSTTDAVAASAPFDVRYLYLAGEFPNGNSPCSACDQGCATQGSPCSGGGCAWWGCWQNDQDPPGAYVRDFVATTSAAGQIPMITYYLALQASGVVEGGDEVAVMNSVSFLSRYFNDFRFFLQQLGSSPAIIHVEPDFWGYAQQANFDPHMLPAAVPNANSVDCPDEEATIVGFARCLVAMAHQYAPNALIGLHGSGWATGVDVLLNTDPGFDVAAHATELANYLVECAPAADLVVVDASDRDAEYYESLGQDRWWDDTNATLPNFDQAFVWSRTLSETAQKPHLWWQVPVGNTTLPGGTNQWKDNRLDYFFAHMPDLAASHSLGAAYGAGDADQTNPETDGGHLVSQTQAYIASGGVPLCP
jgi:hypothetical protein